MKVDEKGFDENKVYWENLSMIGKICEINNEKFICMDDKLGVVSWVNAPMLIKEVEFLRNQIELMKICDSCTYNRGEYENIHDMCHSCKKHSNWKIKQ